MLLPRAAQPGRRAVSYGYSALSRHYSAIGGLPGAGRP